ncbi:PREDICTED: uncharacterized protein LOC109464106 [Branchiostoma belcheri]|uniref:Uncharacterized protein LOC109464106 n=1 Tax=Branchiostoma belcheri TaxID=7741 RepID=A0A6P4Y2F8_BRABE|nr:PREDICTED: uncharacterized protein LOC109464106 [Branchiostoma belcheri]
MAGRLQDRQTGPVDEEEYFDKVVKGVSHKWDDLARKLGFDRNEIKGIGTTEPSPDHRCREVLHRWRNREGRKASLQVLNQTLINIDERLTAESLDGKKTRRKRKRKRKPKQPKEDDSSEKSSSMGNDPHNGPAPSHNYFIPVAKAVGSSWGKFAVEQLGLTAEDVVNIQVQHPSSIERQALQALELWRHRRGRKTCRVKLAGALRKGGFIHTADELDNGHEVKTHIPNHKQWTEPSRKKRKTQDSLQIKQESEQSYHVACAESNGTNGRDTVDQRAGTSSNGTQHFNGRTEDGYETSSTSSRSSQQHESSSSTSSSSTSSSSTSSSSTSGEESDSVKGPHFMQPSNVKLEGKQQNGKSRKRRRQLQNRAARQKKRIKPDPEAGKMPGSIKGEADSNDPDMSVPNGSDDDKGTIYHFVVKTAERMFDKKTVENYDEFAKCVKSFENVASAVPDEDVIDKKPILKLQSWVKLRIKVRVSDKIAEMAQIIFTDEVLDPGDRELFHKMAECFGRFQSALRKAERGCVLCYLDFADVGCFDTFWRGYSDGSLSDTLTRELITDDMRAAEGGADLYVHVRVLHSATEEGDFSDQDPSGTADRGPPHPGPSGEHTGQGPPAPGSGNHGDDTPPGYHGDGPGGLQVSGGDDVIQVKQEPAEQMPSCCMMGNVKSEIKGELAGPFPKREETELDRQLAAVADQLGSMWERLALSLGFTTDFIRNLTASQPPALRPRQLICDWMERNAGDVTLDQLVQALRDAGIHQVADAAASGQLFETAVCSEAEKEKPEDDMDASSPGRQTSPDKGKEKGFDTSSSSEEDSDDRNAENGDDAADSGELFLTETDCDSAKGKADGDLDTANPAEKTSPKQDSSDSSSSSSSSSSDEESDNMKAERNDDGRLLLKRKRPNSSSSDSIGSSDEEEEHQGAAVLLARNTKEVPEYEVCHKLR